MMLLALVALSMGEAACKRARLEAKTEPADQAEEAERFAPSCVLTSNR
jgi:hypothetical protein